MLQQRGCRLGGRINQVLTVVQEQQKVLIADRGGQRINERHSLALGDAELCGHGGRHQVGVNNVCKLDQPHTSGIVRQHLGSSL